MREGCVRYAVAALVLAALISFPVAFAQAPAEVRGPRPEVAFGTGMHDVTLTFYIGQNDTGRLQETLDVLQENNVTEAVFFMHPNLPKAIVNSTSQLGYTVLPWSNGNEYDRNFAPSSFDGILLSDRAVLTRTDKTADVVAFYNLALHQSNSSVIAFTPSVLPQFNSTSVLLEEILKDGGRTLAFTSEGGQSSAGTSMAITPVNATIGGTAIGANTTSSITVEQGDWTMQTLQARFPQSISLVQTGLGPSYLVNTTIIVGENAQLSVAGENVLVASPAAGDRDRRIEVSGRMSITNSLVSSWDVAANAPDVSPYHQRPFIFSDGGHLDIKNSTIQNLGFPLGGLSEVRSARAAIMFHDSSNFAIANSTIKSNYDGIYAKNSSNFQIAGNDIFGNTRSGIDIRGGSHNFTIIENRVHDNGYEGIICTECTGVTIARNVADHNKEAGIKLFSRVNSTNVQENTVRYNEKFGIYLKGNSTGNLIRENTIAQSRAGITLIESSNSNFLVGNVIQNNDVAIDADGTSQSNVLRNNRLG